MTKCFGGLQKLNSFVQKIISACKIKCFEDCKGKQKLNVVVLNMLILHKQLLYNFFAYSNYYNKKQSWNVRVTVSIGSFLKKLKLRHKMQKNTDYFDFFQFLIIHLQVYVKQWMADKISNKEPLDLPKTKYYFTKNYKVFFLLDKKALGF